MLSTATFLALAMQCAPNVHPATLRALVQTESSFNPYAIGVVGKRLDPQPTTLPTALAAVKKLTHDGDNFSVGLGQINRQYFDVNHPETMFQPCPNLKVVARLLQQCYTSAKGDTTDPQAALHKALSCYYSGNFTRGFKPDSGGTSYVQRVLAANTTTETVPALAPDGGTPTAAPTPAPTPTYESWDVLREYPRYDAPKTDTTPPKVDGATTTKTEGKNA